MVNSTVFASVFNLAMEKEMVTHSSMPAMENPMDRRAWWATVHGSQELDMT